jgi:hypothetical protein
MRQPLRGKDNTMKQSYTKIQGYKYYVYVRPGVLEFFFAYQYSDAEEYARMNGAEVQEVL